MKLQGFFMAGKRKHKWLRNKGYLHITPQIKINNENRGKILAKLRDEDFIENYNFFPLIHSSIKERKYKYIPGTTERAHSYWDIDGKKVKTAKERPLHYATHMDALIYGYYGELLQIKYDCLLKEKFPELDECIVAYRKIKIGGTEKNKSTAHFASDVFAEIKRQSSPSCAVLMFDIENFFPSIDHGKLEKAWSALLNKDLLPNHHRNVFRATTRFSYIMLDDLREKKPNGGKRNGFDEGKLHEIREEGKFAFFSSPKEFREKIKNKELKVYVSPFKDAERNVPVGIPQGLPISPVLANVYLLDFDVKILNEVVIGLGSFYRRYSDDILIVCKPENVEKISDIVKNALLQNFMKPSKKKTEQFLFKDITYAVGKKRLTSIKMWTKDNLESPHRKYEEATRYEYCHIGAPLTYLGFEFYGYQTLIKSANLSKFYRRMITSVKRKAKRAIKLHEADPENPLAVFKNQLEKIYLNSDLREAESRKKKKHLEQRENGTFKLVSKEETYKFKSNYLSYAKRVSKIMGDEEKIEHQMRKHSEIFFQAINKHLKKNRNG